MFPRRRFRVRTSSIKKDNSPTVNSDAGNGLSEDSECVDLFAEERPTNSEFSNSSIIARPLRIAETDQTRDFVKLITALLIAALLISVVVLVLAQNLGLQWSFAKVFNKLMKLNFGRQMLCIIGTMIFVRSGLTPVVRVVRELLKVKTPWENSTEYYILKELHSPLELLLGVAGLAAISESVLPTLIAVPRSIIVGVVRSIVTLTLIVASARVAINIKTRILRESKWRLEIEGKTTDQHRIGAVDKLLSIAISIVASILGLQSMGLDVNSVLAIGGVGGLAIGLAGRQIFENLFSGLLIMGSRPFDVGDEIRCLPASGASEKIEGIVVEIGWYRTVVRNWERELYVIPNSLFSRSVVLNITRKGKEWRFFEFIPLRLKDLDKVEKVLSDIRRIQRQDSRIIQKLYKRAFVDKINREFVNIHIAFYLEVPNRDAFMAAKQQLYLAFVECVVRNGAEIAEKKLIVEYQNNNATLPAVALEMTKQLVATDSIPSKETLDEFYNGDFPTTSHVEVTRDVQSISTYKSSLDDCD